MGLGLYVLKKFNTESTSTMIPKLFSWIVVLISALTVKACSCKSGDACNKYSLSYLVLLVTVSSNTNTIERYGYHQRENTGSHLFTEVKPCWTGLISGWVTI